MTTSTNASPKAAAAPPSSFPGSTNLGPPLAASRRPRRPSPQSWTPRPPRRPPFRRPQRPTTAPQAHLLRTLLRSRPTPPVVLFLSLLPLCTAHVPPDSGATTPPILPNRLPTPVSLCPNPFPSASLGTAPISLSSATATTFTSPNAAGPLNRSEPDHGVFHFLVEPTSDHAAPDLPRAMPSPACPISLRRYYPLRWQHLSHLRWRCAPHLPLRTDCPARRRERTRCQRLRRPRTAYLPRPRPRP